MWKLLKIEKLTNEKFLNYYKVTFLSPNGKEVNWSFASRNNEENLVCKTGKINGNGVCIIPKTIINDEPALIITKEYRLPIGNYVYGFPAGIIDNNEDVVSAAIRELHEEVGVTKVDNVKLLTGPCLNSEGMTDESTYTVELDVLEIGKQNLQDEEDIQYEIVKIKDLEKYIKDKILSVRAGMYIPMIVREYELIKKLKE